MDWRDEQVASEYVDEAQRRVDRLDAAMPEGWLDDDRPFVNRAHVMPGLGAFEPICSCGWRGDRVADSEGARATAIAHVTRHHDHDPNVRVFGVDKVWITYEHKPSTSGGELHRWRCSCGKPGVWLERETVAARNAALHIKHHAEEAK